MNRVNDLNMEHKEIIREYIKNAPKKFGNNLKLVMERQGMTEQDIAMMIGVTPSVIQSLEKCEATETEQGGHQTFMQGVAGIGRRTI